MRFHAKPLNSLLRHHALIWALIFTAALAESAGAQLKSPAPPSPVPANRRITRQIAPGIRHVQVLQAEPERTLAVNMVRADLRQPGWRLQVWPGQDVLLTPDATHGRETVGKLAARRGALAAINGDFFPFTGDPLGLEITDGEIVSEPYPNRSAFGLTRDGRTLWGPVHFEASVRIGDRSFPLRGINRARKANELVVYTPRYGAATGANAFGSEVVVEWLNGPLRAGTPVTGAVSAVHPGAGNSAIPPDSLVLSGHGPAAEFLRQANVGDAVSVEITLSGEENQDWNAVWQAVGGGPRLLKHGEACVGPGVEGFRNDVLRGCAPRSAVALTSEGELLLVAVDGRQEISGGMSLAELAAWLRAEGAVEAINLDGGGSTTFALRQLVVNSPSDASQRPIANALLLFSDNPAPEQTAEIGILPPEGAAEMDGALTLPAGAPARFRAARRAADGSWEALPEDAVTWALSGKIGVMAQDGTFEGFRVGSGEILLSDGRQTVSARIATLSGPPAAITTAFEPGANGEAAVRARVVDAHGNPVPNANLSMTYTTTAGPQEVPAVTNLHGEARLPFPAAQLAPTAPVLISTTGAPPATVKVPRAK